MRPMSIEEAEKLDAELKAKGMRRSPEAEAERVERLRLRKLFAPMKPALMKRIQLGEGLHESMKGRRFTEEELSDMAELRINEMVSDQMEKKEHLISEHNQAAIADQKEICDKDHHGLWFNDEEDRDV